MTPPFGYDPQLDWEYETVLECPNLHPTNVTVNGNSGHPHSDDFEPKLCAVCGESLRLPEPDEGEKEQPDWRDIP